MTVYILKYSEQIIGVYSNLENLKRAYRGFCEMADFPPFADWEELENSGYTDAGKCSMETHTINADSEFFEGVI